MKKRITSFFALCIALVCFTVVLAGCEPEKDPNEIIGVYSLKQMQVYYQDGTRKVYNVDYENNENEMLKKLSGMVYNHYNHRYEVSKSAGDYLLNKKRYSADVDNFVTMESHIVTPEWDSANNCFILKGPKSGDPWYYVESKKDGYYYEGPQFSVNNTILEVEEFRGFMQENDIRSILIWYGLEK